MPRHNREARGRDQRGADYTISYQPDWVRSVKVTRKLESGRQSTKTVFRNPGYREQSPGPRVRTRVSSEAMGVDFEVSLDDPKGVVRRIVVETVVPGEGGEEETILFTLDDMVPPPPPLPPPPPDDERPG